MKNKKENEESIRELFIKRFVEALIMNSKPTELIEEKISAYIPSEGIITQQIPLERTMGQITKIQEIGQQNKQLMRSPHIQQIPQNFFPTRRELIKPIELQSFAPSMMQSQQTPLEKLAPLLRDYSISSIECPGPEKNLIIHKSGLIQTAPITLTKEEIDEIMNYISQKTRIPLIKGVFKAIMQNLIISAVISEFVGTRFNIEKRRPPPATPIPRHQDALRPYGL